MVRIATAVLACGLAAGCGGTPAAPPPPLATARNLVIISIDTLRADRVGAYGYAAARTPALDALAQAGTRFSHAFSTAPITLTSHASLMTGRYPAGHGARHNGMRLDPATPTLAARLSDEGFATGAFIAAFPLDRRFGLMQGFATYGDRMPPPTGGQAINERPGRLVVDEALAWLDRSRHQRFFLWVHLFEPHAPYGDPAGTAARVRTASARYDDEIAEADTQVRRLLDALGDVRASTIVVATADHGEAFGEHGEIGHSLFVYDTTLRVPLILAGPGVPAGRTLDGSVSLVDVVPTVMRLLGLRGFDADGLDLTPAMAGTTTPTRELYAESFAPLLDFGWSPLRSVRTSGFKYIEAPTPELYDLAADPGESTNVASSQLPRAAALRDRVRRYAGADLAADRSNDPEARARLQALGYASGSRAAPGAARPDPKDRRELAARISQVASGELHGAALEAALRRILADDPGNPQAHLRVGYVLLDRRSCREAVPHFRSAIAGHLPSADAHLGLAGCQAADRRFDAAAHTLREAGRVEPDNPVVLANLGMVLSDGGHPAEAVDPLQRALARDPDRHQARFALALALARLGRRADAAATARDLLTRLPADAPQRAEVERLIKALE